VVRSLEHYEASARRSVQLGDVVGAATEETTSRDPFHQGDCRSALCYESALETLVGGSYRGVPARNVELGRLEARAGNVGAGAHCSKKALRDFRAIRSPVFIAETEVRLDECLVLEATLRRRWLARAIFLWLPGTSRLEQVELTTLRLLDTARASAEFADGSGAESSE